MYTPGAPSISVIVPVYSGGEDFRRCLLALTEAEPPPSEIIVIVDGNDDRAVQLARSFGVRANRTSVRRGPAFARNLGAQMASGELLFFVDADVLVSPGVMGQVAAAFAAEPELAALFGSYDDAPAATNFLSQYKNLFHHYVHQIGNEESSSFWAGCGAIRRQVFVAVGGFHEGYAQPAIEDIELGYRLNRAGYKVRLHKALQVKHLKRWEAGSLLKADLFQRAVPWTVLILRDRQFVNDLNLRTISRVSVLLSFTLAGALLGALWWPASWAVAGTAAVLLLVLNARLYAFFRRKRGLLFALESIPWHWIYYLYSGIGFAIGVCWYLGGRLGLVRAHGPAERQELDKAEEGLEL
jgi:glycosyltransferase involved in cell wall biosynthesis